MTKQQMTQYKNNHIDNRTLEFVCKTGRVPSIATITKWSKEADENLRNMVTQLAKRQ